MFTISPRYWDVEARLVPVHAETDFVMHPPDAMQYIDENTIGVMIIMGSTYTGHFENVQLMSDLRTCFQLTKTRRRFSFVLSGRTADEDRFGRQDPR